MVGVSTSKGPIDWRSVGYRLPWAEGPESFLSQIGVTGARLRFKDHGGWGEEGGREQGLIGG